MNPPTDPTRSALAWWLTFALAALAVYMAIAHYPTPPEFITDHGQGYQLAGAAEILSGRHPFIDFKDVYGPLTFYASAAAQWLSGGRVGGELALGCLALGLSCAILFRLMLGCAIPISYAAAATLVTIAVQPVAYRYYLFLLPMLFFLAAWRYIARPGRGRLAVLALVVTVAGLFRPDVGIATWASGLIAVVFAASDQPEAWKAAARFTVLVALWAAPWLGWLAAHGQLGAYLYDSSVKAFEAAAGMARPAPGVDWSDLLSDQNAKAFLFRLPVLLLVFAAAMLVVRRAELRGPQRARLLCAFAFVVLTLAQASHIVDWIHMRDTLPMRILFLAWIAAGSATAANAAPGRTSRFARFVPRGLAAIVGAILLFVGQGRPVGTEFVPREAVQKLRDYWVRPEEFVDRLHYRGGSYHAAICYLVRNHSRPDEGLFAVLEAPELNYFAHRPLAGGQLALLPGIFSSPADQRELIRRLQRDNTTFVVIEQPQQAEYPGLSLARIAPELTAYLRREFVFEAQVGYCFLLRARSRPMKPIGRPPDFDFFRESAPPERPPPKGARSG